MAMKPKAAKLMIAIMGKPTATPGDNSTPKAAKKKKATAKGKAKSTLPWSSQNHKSKKGC